MKLNEIITTNFSSIFEENLLQELSNNGILKKAEPEKIILEIRRKIEFIPLIVSGVVKVMHRDGKGNGIFLHFLTKNQVSAIAITYALENKISEIRLEAQSNIVYIAIPAKVVNSWFLKYSSWRSFYFQLNQQQTSFLIEKIDDIAFTCLENRLLKYLQYTSLIKNDKTINIKHFDIARDLKVSRESVSRALKKLEQEELITLGRNKIYINQNKMNPTI
ncbi:Crp/Fnr family transcriptional regulator [Lutibacter sp.]|uniref:Crp/Fnr family transcriptional regulator n=1 Tax=Lutibacter sp. TaxID=1925666 RepID=UPI0025C2FB2F|nr:Crp/Fnr family transcriptional regulator [Lutibacter sp.]MCF6167729.1 Crp/Fnr family transcriptional regulator [Lutibacter sp.]